MCRKLVATIQCVRVECANRDVHNNNDDNSNNKKIADKIVKKLLQAPLRVVLACMGLQNTHKKIIDKEQKLRKEKQIILAANFFVRFVLLVVFWALL